MARLKLDLPETFAFSTPMTVRIGDVNYGRHLGNDAVLALAHEARLLFLRKHGFSEIDAGGCGMIMADAAIVFKAQAFHGDVLTIDVAVADWSRCGCDFVYRFSKADGTEVARIKTGIVFFNYETNRVESVPEKFKAAMTTQP